MGCPLTAALLIWIRIWSRSLPDNLSIELNSLEGLEMSHDLSDVVAMRRLRLAISGMVVGALCLVGVVNIVLGI